MTDTRVVLVSAPDRDEAVGICHSLLSEGLVACGNVVSGVTSVYRWKGQVEEDSEYLIILKTTAERAPEVVKRVPELHSYDVPEVLVMEVAAGFQPYLTWVAEETAGSQEPR